MVVVHINTDEVIAELRARGEEFREGIERGMARAGAAVVDLFRTRWLSGRGSDDLGLNIRTGRLYQSIRSLTEIDDATLRSVVFNSGAVYWYYHQTGTDRLPKRLFLEETFEEDGQALYASEISLALRGLAA